MTHQAENPSAIGAVDVQPLADKLAQVLNRGQTASDLVGSLVTPISQNLPARHEAGLPVAPASEMLSVAEVADRLERYGVVKQAPRFVDQAVDDQRVTPFRYAAPFERSYKRGTMCPKIEGEATEAAGLNQIHRLLTNFTRRARDGDRSDELAEQAKDMLENITFMGEKEYTEAARGIGLLWKSYLDGDPHRKICLITEINQLDRYKGTRKSDDYLKQRVLETFTDDELSQYSGRIVDRLEDMDATPENGRVILVDDWALSGKQMREEYQILMKNPKFRQFYNAGSVEANLMVASGDRIKNGLRIQPRNPAGGSLKVRAYYRSHIAKTAHQAHSSYITGLHSPVNYGFAEICRKVAKKSRGSEKVPPMLTRVYPSYREEQPTISISPSGVRRLSRDEQSLVRRQSEARQTSGRLALVNTPASKEEF